MKYYYFKTVKIKLVLTFNLNELDIVISDTINFINNEKKFVKSIKIYKSDNINVLEPYSLLNLNKYININIVKKYVNIDIESNKEYYNDTNSTYKISNSDKAEWIIHKSIINSKLIGQGNTNVDIKLELNNKILLIDVCVLTLNGSMTNEKSILQNFTSSNDLDQLFIDEKGIEAVSIFRDKLLLKYNDIKDYKCEYYYLIFICNKKNIYLTCLKFNSKNIKNIRFDTFIKSSNKTERKNILVSNFIDRTNGNVKLYKSKKRLELRLSSTLLDKDCTIKIY